MLQEEFRLTPQKNVFRLSEGKAACFLEGTGEGSNTLTYTIGI